ncbi:MAG TPA: hypothetical protein VG815_16325 [Chloroflexota bacterium]|jgi:hypothetical protein|nr:hypothetical protein [Chloroflexota bacterium]
MSYGRISDFQESDEPPELSRDFERRLSGRLRLADSKRERISTVRRWRWTAFVAVPLISGVCWAALPWTFGPGVRAIIGFVGYFTLLLSVAGHIDSGYLTYLGLGLLPRFIDVLLLVGVVSWLVWASRAQAPSRSTTVGP